jgi:hypothetical protein
VANVTLPTPVFLAGGAVCLLAGYLIGAVAGPDTPHRTTATVVSFDSTGSQLCLKGSAVKHETGTSKDGVLCGTWNHAANAVMPHKGDEFRFVSTSTKQVHDSKTSELTVLYGTVVQ